MQGELKVDGKVSATSLVSSVSPPVGTRESDKRTGVETGGGSSVSTLAPIIAIDPGSAQSAWIEYTPGKPGSVGPFGIYKNEELVENLRGLGRIGSMRMLAIEMMQPRGLPTSYEEMVACVWIGRFIESWAGPWAYVYRAEEKYTLCGNRAAADKNIRQALIDRWGSKKEIAIGKKKSPGPLFGISNDVWQALAIAVTYAVREGQEPQFIAPEVPR